MTTLIDPLSGESVKHWAAGQYAVLWTWRSNEWGKHGWDGKTEHFATKQEAIDAMNGPLPHKHMLRVEVCLVKDSGFYKDVAKRKLDLNA